MVMKIENIFKNKKWHLYHLRWQTSGLVIAPFIYFFQWIDIPLWLGVVCGNSLGAILYWFYDKHCIFKKEK